MLAWTRLLAGIGFLRVHAQIKAAIRYLTAKRACIPNALRG